MLVEKCSQTAALNVLICTINIGHNLVQIHVINTYVYFFKIPFQGPSRPIRGRTMALRLCSLSPDVVPLSRPLYPQSHLLNGRRYPGMTRLPIKPYNMYIAVFCHLSLNIIRAFLNRAS